MEAIKAENLSFAYKAGESGDRQIVLKGLNFQIQEGSFTAVLGHNGSGKSTLAKHFNALLLHPISKQFIAAMGDVRMHPMSYRRYMWKFDY